MSLGDSALTLAASILGLSAYGDEGWPLGTAPVLTDRVVVNEVFDPKVGSGILAIYAKVTGTTAHSEKREYSVLYMGQGQTLPAVGASCDITYRYGRLAHLTDFGGKPFEWRSIEHFAC